MSDPLAEYNVPEADPLAAYTVPDLDALTRPTVKAERGILNALFYGVQDSATGLAVRGELPSRALPEDATRVEQLAATASSIVTDIPLSVAGAVGGVVAGGAMTVNPLGAIAGGGAGAMGAPMALREALMTAYQQGGVNSFSDAWEVTKSAMEGGGKGVVIGAATLGAGKYAKGIAPLAGKTLGKAAPYATGAAVLGAEVATMTTTAAALEGRLPTRREFEDAALMIGGLKTAIKIGSNLRTLYGKTGIPPSRAALEATRDPKLTKDLETLKDGEVPAKYEALAAEENAKAAIPDPVAVKDRAKAAEFVQDPFAAVKQGKGEPTRPTEVNHNYLNAEADIHMAEARLAGLYEAQTQTARRGQVPVQQSINDASKLLADALGETPGRMTELLTGTVEQSKLASTLLARRQIYTDTLAELVKQGKALTEAGANVTEAQMLRYMALTERSAMLRASFLGLRAEVARAQQSLKSIVSPETLDIEAVKRILIEHGGTDNIRDFAKHMSAVDNPAAAGRAASQYVKPGALEKSIEAWKASILSGPTTHLANLFGNATNLMMQFPVRAIAAGLGKLHAGEKVTFAETQALGNGMLAGSLDALKLSGKAVLDAVKLREQTILDGSKTEQYRSAISGKKGEAVRIPFKLLTAEDLLFRTLNERGEAYALATRQAIKEGLDPGTKEHNARVVDLVQNPPDAMATAIKDAGHKGVFTTKLGKTGTHLQLAVKGTVFEFMVPFIRTPINLLKSAAEFAPGLNLLMKNVREDLAGKNGAAARDIASAKMIVGTSIGGVLWNAVEEGTVTGGGLADPEARRAKVAAGWQSYSIKIDGEYYSYARIDPIARLLSAVADMAELSKAAGENEKLQIAAATVSAIGNATISQTYLSGLANAIQALTEPGRYGPRWLDQYAASLVPGAIGQVAAEIDPQAREVNSVFEAIQARIPILREQLLAKRNPLTGEPISGADRLFPFAPVIKTTAAEDPVLTEAMRLGVRLPIAPRKVHVGKGSGKIGDVEITPEARNTYTRVQGEFAHQILTQIVNTPMWEGLPDMAKSKVYTKVLQAARKKAALEALPPEARMAEAMRISDEIAVQMGR